MPLWALKYWHGKASVDSSGYAGANFYTSLNRKYEGFDYALRSDDYTLFRHQNEEDDAFDMRKGGATCAPPSSC